MQFIAVEVFIYLFRVFAFSYKTLFVCVKDRPCLKIAIPAYRFNIFGSVFGVLFCLLIKELIIEVKPSENHEKVSMCTLKFKDISSYEQRSKFFFLEDYTLVWSDFFR